MESGTVYILSNPAFSKNLLKVGMTTLKKASERAKQISRHEGVPKNYEVVWEKNVPNIALAENVLHYFLHKYAYNKEFFVLSQHLAIEICSEVIDRVFKPIDMKKIKEAVQERKRIGSLENEALLLKKELQNMEVEQYANEKKGEISILPVGTNQTNWDSVSESLSYNFGKEAIKLILKEKKKGDPIRKRFLVYRTDYYGAHQIHLFFAKKYISVYVNIDKNRTPMRTVLKRRYGSDYEKRLDVRKITEGFSFKIKNSEDFKTLKAILHMGQKAEKRWPLKRK